MPQKNINKIFGHVRKVETLTSATKSLVAADSGTTFFVNIDDNTITVTFPTTDLVAGVWFKFILATASDNEGTFDLVLSTGDDDVDFGGTIHDGGGLVEVTSTTSKITLDTSAGAATVGDWVECIYDGTDWYVSGMLLNNSELVIADAA